MSITINTKADTANTLIWEARRFRELFETSNRTVTGAYNETSDTSAINYTGSDGEQGELDKIFATLQTASNDWIATDWNLFQSETNTSLIALETPAYSNISATGLREKVLTGNIGGALTQTMSGESAINLLGDIGGFYKDDDANNLANGWSSTLTTSESLLDQIQSFTPSAQFGQIVTTENYIIEDSDIYYIRSAVKTSKSTVRLAAVGATEISHSGSGDFEILSFLYTADSTDRQIAIYESDTGSFSEIQVKETMIINLTNEGDAGLSLVQADLKYANYFDNIGHATINQKITGTNGEFELKETYVLPKDPAGTASETVTLDGQNFARLKHKLFVIDGDFDWADFGSNTNTYKADLNAFRTNNNLFSATNSGNAINNDGRIPINSDLDDDRHIVLIGGGDEALICYIEKALINAMPSGGTLAGFKEYLNANPIHCYFRIDSSANYIDIPIKHLESIAEGTYTNNSQILPSAHTITQPENEAAQRESAEIAQGQITTTMKSIVEDVNTVYTGGLVTDEQGVYSINRKTIYENGLIVAELNINMNDETEPGVIKRTEYINGLVTKEYMEVV